MRSEKIVAIDETKKLKTRIVELEVVVSQKDMEIESLKLTPEKYKARYAKQIQELNESISQLKIERNDLQKKIAEIESEKEKEDTKKSSEMLIQVQAQLKLLESTYEELKSSVE